MRRRSITVLAPHVSRAVISSRKSNSPRMYWFLGERIQQGSWSPGKPLHVIDKQHQPRPLIGTGGSVGALVQTRAPGGSVVVQTRALLKSRHEYLRLHCLIKDCLSRYQVTIIIRITGLGSYPIRKTYLRYECSPLWQEMKNVLVQWKWSINISKKYRVCTLKMRGGGGCDTVIVKNNFCVQQTPHVHSWWYIIKFGFPSENPGFSLNCRAYLRDQ